MSKEFVTYEISKKISELGFNGNCFAYYDQEVLKPVDTDFINFRELSDFMIKAPLWQQVTQWLRDKHNTYCEIGIDHYEKYFYSISELSLNPYRGIYKIKDKENFLNHNEALEAGILEIIDILNKK